MYPQRIMLCLVVVFVIDVIPFWSTSSYICFRGTSVPSQEEINQIIYIFQIHFTLEVGCDYYLFWDCALNTC